MGLPCAAGRVHQRQWSQVRHDLSGYRFRRLALEGTSARGPGLPGQLPRWRHATFTLNFSRPGNQVIGQYYNFIRLGVAGYTQIMETLRDTALMLSKQISEIENMAIITDGSAIPVISFEVTGDPGFTVFDISHELRARGFQVPAYTMPADAEDVAVLRIVLREGFSRDIAHKLGEDIADVVGYLREGVGRGHTDQAFAH